MTTTTPAQTLSTDTPGASPRRLGRGGRRLLRPPSFELRMMLPALIPLAIVSLVPFGYIVWMSFSKVSLVGGVHMTWLGVDNWSKMFSDPNVLSSWKISAVFFGATLLLEMVVGVGIAILINEIIFARNIVLSVLLMPMFVAPVIVGLLGRFLTDSTFGLYTWGLSHLGIGTNILGHKSSAMATVIVMDVWEWTPLVMLITLAGLAAVPKALIEASSLDGATYFQRLRFVVLPSISGVVLVALLVRAMDAIRFFDIIWITTNGGPADATKVIPLRLYETAFRFFDLGYAAAIGLGMLAFSIIFANIFVSLLEKRGATR